MWTCPKCKRIFKNANQMHSCKSLPIEEHFKNKDFAKTIYDELFNITKTKVGPCEVISLPCCIHWFGKYDFIALLPHKDKLEVRFALNREIKSSRIYTAVRLSASSFKNCLYLNNIKEIDDELIGWIKESYDLR